MINKESLEKDLNTIKDAIKDYNPIVNNIYFAFVEDVSSGKFQEMTDTGLIVSTKKENQMDKPRWGVVLKVGSGVDEELDINVGDFILVEPLMWTNKIEIETHKLWMTNSDKVMAVSDTMPDFSA